MNIVNRVRKHAKLCAIPGAFILAAGAALADGPTAPDYSTAISGFKDSMESFFTTNGPPLLIALGGVLMFGIVWKLIKRVGKSV